MNGVSKTETSRGALFLAFFLSLLILLGFTLIPHFDKYVREMQRWMHTARGIAVSLSAVLLLSVVLKLVFVDLWAWRETRSRRKGIRSA
jgi:hypothetical protein